MIAWRMFSDKLLSRLDGVMTILADAIRLVCLGLCLVRNLLREVTDRFECFV